ncbi:MAG: GntR family transcriptional regulator [Lentisphaeria bacterium]|nr:GntR family transcriptional regulator [Lentisphaeria bacterium]
MARDTKKMQIYDLLKERIDKGFYPPGSRLPKEVDLADELRISRITLRPALELLELEGLVCRLKGRGTFVRDSHDIQTRIMMLIYSEVLQGVYKASSPSLYIIPCIQLAAERMNVKLEICEAQSLLTPDSEQCAARIRKLGIQGILWLANNFTGKEPLLETIRKTNLPVLLPHSNPSDAQITGFTAMGTNYEQLTRDGLKYLAAQGHRRVGYIGGKDMRNIALVDYFNWVKTAGLDPDPELLRLIDWRQGKQTVFDAVAQLLNLPDPPTAIFSYSDYLSLQIYEYLHREKVRIPDDVCVLTIGGQIGCDFLDPPLSALEYGNQEIADLALMTILQMIHDKRRMEFIVTPHYLRVRESTKRVILHHNKSKKQKETWK